MNAKKSKLMKRIAAQLWLHSDKETSSKTIKKNMKKVYKQTKGEK